MQIVIHLLNIRLIMLCNEMSLSELSTSSDKFSLHLRIIVNKKRVLRVKISKQICQTEYSYKRIATNIFDFLTKITMNSFRKLVVYTNLYPTNIKTKARVPNLLHLQDCIINKQRILEQLPLTQRPPLILKLSITTVLGHKSK